MLSKFYRQGFRFICLSISVRLAIRCIKYKYDYSKYKKFIQRKSTNISLLVITNN